MAIKHQSVEQGGFTSLDATHDTNLQQAVFLHQITEGLFQVFAAIDGVPVQHGRKVFFQLRVVGLHPLVQALVQFKDVLRGHD